MNDEQREELRKFLDKLKRENAQYREAYIQEARSESKELIQEAWNYDLEFLREHKIKVDYHWLQGYIRRDIEKALDRYIDAIKHHFPI